MISWYIDSSCITSPANTRSRGHHPGLARGTEETLGVADPVSQLVYLGVRVVHVERRPGAGLHAQLAVQRPGAVMPGAHRDAQLIEHLAHVVRVDACHLERDGAA